MSEGYWKADGTWVDTSRAVDWMDPNQPIESASSNKESTMDIEDPNMWQQVSTYIANRLVTASDLAKRVEELERLCNDMEVQLRGYADDLAMEKASHTATRQQLQEVQTKLDHEQRAVHDLVMERDIVVEERNKAQEERDNARRDAAAGWDAHKIAEKAWEEERQRNHILEERCNLLTQRIAGLKEAWGSLQNL